MVQDDGFTKRGRLAVASLRHSREGVDETNGIAPPERAGRSLPHRAAPVQLLNFPILTPGYIASSGVESGKAEDSFALTVHQRLQESSPLKKVCAVHRTSSKGISKSAVLNTLSRGLVLAEVQPGRNACRQSTGSCGRSGARSTTG